MTEAWEQECFLVSEGKTARDWCEPVMAGIAGGNGKLDRSGAGKIDHIKFRA